MSARARFFALTIVYCIIVCLLPKSASAGSYKVYSCHFPDGRIASSGGWEVVSAQPGAGYDVSCSDASGSLGVWVTGDRSYARGYNTAVRLKVPSDLRITEASAQHTAWGSATPDWWWSAGYWAESLDHGSWEALNIICGGQCSVGMTDWHLVMRGTDAQSIGLGVQCSVYRDHDCPAGSIAGVRLSGLELTLADDFVPEMKGALRGTLLDPSSAERVRTVQYAVSDRGSGLRTAALEIDGQTVQTEALGAGTGDCTVPYDTPAPCPLAVSGEFAIDTSELAPGEHAARLLVYDASDNPPLESSFKFSVFDPSRPIASCVRGTTLSIKVLGIPARYGASELVFTAEADAPLPRTLLVTDEEQGSRVVSEARLRRGKYVAPLAFNRARSLRVAAQVEAQTFACSEVTHVPVKAGLTLAVAPKVVSNGDTITIRGRLLGGATAAQRRVEIQARARGGPRTWTLVRSLQTNRRGQFSMTYTFRRTYANVHYAFRAVKRREDGFPFAVGASPVRTMFVRGQAHRK